MSILITGCAGFIGMHLTKKLTKAGHKVVGVDSINNSYSTQLKLDRLSNLGVHNDISGNFISLNQNLTFYKLNIQDSEAVNDLFKEHKFDVVVNLAAQTGVRESIKKPDAYIENNINGFLSILEACRKYPVKHLIFASSSSVYGLNKKIPFAVSDVTSEPASIYAATKKSNELMAHSYSHLFNIPVTGLRFFTVYGPWYRPDMAMYIFADAITNDRKIPVFNFGKMKRDFTYVDDVTDAIDKLLNLPPTKNMSSLINNEHSTPYQIYNIGNSKPVDLINMIHILEEKLKKKAIMELLPLQQGDIEVTYADIKPLEDKINFKPRLSIDEGIEKFAEWYKNYSMKTKVITV